MSYIQTASGLKFDAFAIDTQTIKIEDIAHGLSQICRFAGACPEFYSVAQHSVIMSRIIDQPHKLAALLHDASEAYLGDIPKHVKIYLGDRYTAMEDAVMKRVAAKFRFRWPLAGPVKILDGDMLETEFRDVWKGRSFDGRPTYGECLSTTIEPWSHHFAKRAFLDRYYELTVGTHL